MGPNVELLEQYGTWRSLTKVAGPDIELAALIGRAVAAALKEDRASRGEVVGTSRGAPESAPERRFVQDAASFNEAVRQHEARKMDQIQRSLSNTHGPMVVQRSDGSLMVARDLQGNVGMTRLASAGFIAETAGRAWLQKVATASEQFDKIEEFEKQAFAARGPLGIMAQRGFGGLKNLVSKAKKPALRSPSASNAPLPSPGGMSRGSLTPASSLTPAPAAAKVAPGSVAPPPSAGSVAPPAAAGKPKPAPANQGSPRAAAQTGAEAATQAAAPAPAEKNKPLIGWKTKAQLGMGAAALGAAYLGSKALSSTANYLNQPAGVYNYGTAGAGPYTPMAVNQYGYPAL